MLFVVNHHNATHRQSFQPVDRIQNSALKPETAGDKQAAEYSVSLIFPVGVCVCVRVPGVLPLWFVALSLCGSKPSGHTAGPPCPEEAERTTSASAG